MTSNPRITLLFGFLGSGKTTLARRILVEWGAKRRLALIVNEFGDVGVDGDILAGNNIDIIQLSSGCLCCTLKGSLLNSIEELADKSELDHIVIEATGVAEPEEMLATFCEPAFLERFDTGPVITVVDTPKYLKIRDMLGPFYEAQVEKCDMIILNKLDLAEAELVDEVREEVSYLNETALVRYAEHCDLDIAELLDGPSSGILARYLERENIAVDKPEDHQHHHDHDDDHDAGHDHHHHGGLHAPAESFVLDMPGPVDIDALKEMFSQAPEKLWRAKGFVKTSEASYLVQYAMGELEITGCGERERHYLVFIGDELDRQWFERKTAAATVMEDVN